MYAERFGSALPNIVAAALVNELTVLRAQRVLDDDGVQRARRLNDTADG